MVHRSAEREGGGEVSGDKVLEPLEPSVAPDTAAEDRDFDARRVAAAAKAQAEAAAAAAGGA